MYDPRTTLQTLRTNARAYSCTFGNTTRIIRAASVADAKLKMAELTGFRGDRAKRIAGAVTVELA